MTEYRRWAWKKPLHHILSRWLPQPCLACSAHLPDGQGLCNPCRAALFPAAVRCTQCGLRMGERLQAFGWTRCRHCRPQPETHCTWVGTDYIAPLDCLIQALKYGGQFSLATPLLQASLYRMPRKNLLLACVRDPHTRVVPMPLSQERLKQRGYNQAGCIAQALVQMAGRGHMAPALLQKIRHTDAQAQLSLRARADNLRKAFWAPRRLTGLRILLVDDVLTTGATLNAARLALLKAGAARVDACVLARTPEKPSETDD